MSAPAIREAPEFLFVDAIVSSYLGLGSRALRARRNGNYNCSVARINLAVIVMSTITVVC
jgi:hypothetical protein